MTQELKTLLDKIAELEARASASETRLARIERCPQVMHLVTTHEATERARELAIAVDEHKAAAFATASAALRRSCESENGRWRALRVAPDNTGCVAVELDLGSLGKVRAAPGAAVRHLRNIDLEVYLKRDQQLAAAVAQGHVLIEDVEIERAIRLERADRAGR
ncbi:MAG: hypothetical protein JWP01_3387 [Myxococcales bacterium]|nr:hypothetical protein [Myxococcales bacterium]